MFQALESHMYQFPHDPPPPFLKPGGLHPYTCKMACKLFAENHGTDNTVPSVVLAIHDAERKLAAWPLPWRGPDEKIRMIDCLRAVFAQPEHRPDRYSFQSEVWMANISAEEYATFHGAVSDHPDRLDGLVVVTVDPSAAQRVQLSCYVRNADGTVTPWEDTGDGEFGGRLATLLDLPSDETDFQIVHGPHTTHPVSRD